MQYAFRTAGIVRGEHPYALVIDNIRKDDSPHDYTWYLPLEYNTQIAKISRPSDHELDLILTGNDPRQTNVPGGGSHQITQPLPALRDTNAVIAADQPMLLVRFLNINKDPKSIPATEAKEVTILENAPAADYKGHMLQRVRRLAVPAHAVSPEFKVLIYPYRQGDTLPTSEWIDKNSVSAAWNDQKDRLDFASTPTGKTNIKISRGDETLVSVEKPIPPLESLK